MKSTCGVRELRVLHAEGSMACEWGHWVEKTRNQNVMADALEGWLYLTNLGRICPWRSLM